MSRFLYSILVQLTHAQWLNLTCLEPNYFGERYVWQYVKKYCKIICNQDNVIIVF